VSVLEASSVLFAFLVLPGLLIVARSFADYARFRRSARKLEAKRLLLDERLRALGARIKHYEDEQ
jgi:hypothetical protein